MCMIGAQRVPGKIQGEAATIMGGLTSCLNLPVLGFPGCGNCGRSIQSGHKLAVVLFSVMGHAVPYRGMMAPIFI